MQAISREKAREIVDQIRENNGGISQADRDRTPEGVLRALDSVRMNLGSAIQTLATNLYTKDTRFVFELIQNAEDNDYTRVEAASEEPFLIFKLHPDKIIVDSNEDGFMEANVRAICKIGKSTKTNFKGYIGEKGIGFKSVFKVASKVHIQSEPFSFFFEHRRGDGGLGMVTPIFENHLEIPPKIRTRMTLTLVNPLEAGNLAKEFYDLPETLLLFLSKLKRITITRSDALGPAYEITYSKHVDSVQHRATLTKLSVFNGVADASRHRTVSTYQIKSRLLKNLPQHHSRLHSNQAEVVLAFPLDSQSVPVIQQQHVFAFLPIRQVGFSFQIQSDFITQASREDIERTDRNEVILSGVAETFQAAVRDFCGHPTLQFQWMRYLPSESIFEPFWAQLLPKIVRLLKETPVLRPWSGGPLKRPDRLKRVPDYCLDEAGEPLFRDMTDEVYLSARYERSDFQLLNVLAVRELSFWDISTRIGADLKDPFSRWKSSTTSDEWVTRSASMLMRSFNMPGSTAEVIGVRALPLIPLQGGSWVSADSGSIFYPDSDRVPVPTDLGLRLVDPQALKNPARKAFFTQLGLQNCVTKDVIALIIKKYNTWSNAPLQSSVSHLRYLYWHLPKKERDLPKTVYLKDQESRPIYRSFVTHGREIIVDDLYFETDERYEAKQLTKKEKFGNDIIFPGFRLHYINRLYMGAMPSDARRYDTSWESWLRNSAGVRRIPRLVKSSTPTVLSDLFLYILRSRKEELVGMLKAHWASYMDLINVPLISALREAAVPCQNGMDAPLRTTYLPLSTLTKICKKFEVDQRLPFLKLPVELDGEARQDWKFLETFDVGHEANTRFYLDVLRQFVLTHQSLSDTSRNILLRIYEAVENYSKADDREWISKFFASENVIHVTLRGSQTSLWTKPDRCVWKAPEFLTEWYSLSNLEGFRGNERLQRLFNGMLGIKDADWNHYLQQIQACKDKGLPCHNIQDIYRRLYLELEEENWKHVRQRFEKRRLVYEPVRNNWYQPSSCLWTADTQISGKVALSVHYADLQTFFVQRLGVEEPNIDTYITELQFLATGDKRPQIEVVKGLIKKVNSFGPTVGALDRLKSYSVFPVQGTDANTSLKKALDLFAIVDRSEYASVFRGKVPILDFDLEEVRELRQTIQALHLEDRYMSQLVVESSTVKDSSKEDTLSNSVQKRAYALFRCAFHYGTRSSRSYSLYHKLKATNVYKSDGISKTITLTLKDFSIAVEGAIGIVHIEEDDQQLRIYVPRRKRELKLCYCTELPEKLAARLCMNDIAAVRVLEGVLTKSSSVLDDMLDHHGVVRVAGIEPAPRTDSEDSLSDEDTGQPVPHVAPPSPTHSPSTPVRRGSSASALYSGSAPNSTSRAGSSSYAGSVFTPQSSQTFTGFSSTPRSSLSPFPERRREGATPEVSTSGHEYRALLDHVIRAASRAQFPRPGVPAPEAASDSNDDTPVVLSDTVFGRRSDGKVSHDVKIGAAGELYAFEFLLNHLLPSFDQTNWKSTIRKEVCVHEKYREMPAWNGRETSDITYNDHETGNPETAYKLTKLLSEYGYLSNELFIHEGASINYYLEVKTTTLGCGTRLFVSKAQYQRMHEMALHPERPATSIYVILRVFNLGQEDMGMRIYVDPATMERNGELDFQAETYTVVPAVEEEL